MWRSEGERIVEDVLKIFNLGKRIEVSLKTTAKSVMSKVSEVVGVVGLVLAGGGGTENSLLGLVGHENGALWHANESTGLVYREILKLSSSLGGEPQSMN